MVMNTNTGSSIAKVEFSGRGWHIHIVPNNYIGQETILGGGVREIGQMCQIPGGVYFRGVSLGAIVVTAYFPVMPSHLPLTRTS